MKRGLLGILLLLPLVSSLSGCLAIAGAGAATGGVLYLKGAYQKSYPVTVQRAYNAALTILETDRTPVTAKEVGATIGSIEAMLTDGKKLKMDFKASGAATTEVTIRIGTFGDKGRSNYFFEMLDRRLK